MPLRIYRRRLPHWRVDGATYFVTWCLQHRRQHLTAVERDTVVATLWHFEAVRYRLEAFVVMEDHVHVMLKPTAGHELEKIVHSWKSFSANQLHRIHGRTGPVWEREYYDSIVRTQSRFETCIRYILNNPRHRWPEIREYPWVWYRGMEGGP